MKVLIDWYNRTDQSYDRQILYLYKYIILAFQLLIVVAEYEKQLQNILFA